MKVSVKGKREFVATPTVWLKQEKGNWSGVSFWKTINNNKNMNIFYEKSRQEYKS